MALSPMEQAAKNNQEAAAARENACFHNDAFNDAVDKTDDAAETRNAQLASVQDTNEELTAAKKAANKQQAMQSTQDRIDKINNNTEPTEDDLAEKEALQEKLKTETLEFENAKDEYNATLEPDEEPATDSTDFDDVQFDKEFDSEVASDELIEKNELYETAKEEEARVLDEQAVKYPESFGNIAKDLKEKMSKVKPLELDKKVKDLITTPPPAIKKIKIPTSTDIIAAGKKEAEYLAEKAKKEALLTPKKALDELLKKGASGKTDPTSHNAAYVHWDSPSSQNMTGRIEDLISAHMQPKMKFAYMGEFPGALEKLDWMIKSMDKPKVDIESIEQIRNNVKRNYPIKYNYGDLSVTFWDDMDHKTISTLYKYFSKSIWNHASVPIRGTFLLRDSIVIPKFEIYELTTNSDNHLKYTFENAILSSFDFDNSEDESDDGVHTVQAVFKIERFDITEGASPSVLTPDSPIWK